MTTEKQKLMHEGIVLSTTQLIPSAVKIDNDLKTRYSAFAYVSDGFLHLRLFDGTSEDLEPYFSFGGKKILDACFWYSEIKRKDEDILYDFSDESDNKLFFLDGSDKEIQFALEFGSFSSILLAAKLIFVNLIQFIITNNDADLIE